MSTILAPLYLFIAGTARDQTAGGQNTLKKHVQDKK
jgi:hypothetical protein